MNLQISLDKLNTNILSWGDKPLSSTTHHCQFMEKDMKKWMAISWTELEAEDARKRLEFPLEHQNLSTNDWLHWI